MSEVPGSRPEIDDAINDSWYLAFAVIAPGADSSRESYDRYSAVVTSMPSDIAPSLSLYPDDAIFSMKVQDTTQKQAVRVAYANLVMAFENSGQTAVVRAARIASRTEVDAALLMGKAPELQDVSLEAIDLERELALIRDVERVEDLGEE